MTPRQRFFASALIGGATGSLAMDIAQALFARVLERDRPVNDQDEETEAISSVVSYLTRVAPGIFRAADAKAVGHGLHYLFGIGFAAGYFLLVPADRPTKTRAAMFGTLLWLLSDRILIPAFGLGRPWSRYSRSERSNALVSHLAYAFVVEFSRRNR